MSKEALKLALEALSPWAGEDANHTEQYAAYQALREALAEQPAQQEEPVRFKCTVVDDAHPNGVPLSKWGQQKPLGLFLTREQAIQFCRKRRPDIEPTEQHIAATIDAYAALFGDMVEALMPAQRTWVGLTDEEILDVNMSTVTKLIDEPIVCDTDHNIIQLGKAIEAKLRSKNEDRN